MAKSACECSDPGCPCAVEGHKGRCTIAYRVDMEDETGTRMCERCSTDAYESGLFTDRK